MPAGVGNYMTHRLDEVIQRIIQIFPQTGPCVQQSGRPAVIELGRGPRDLAHRDRTEFRSLTGSPLLN
jgi:hypothetical protein